MEIIDYYHILFIGTNVAADKLSYQDKMILKKHGIDPTTLKGGKLEEAYRFGLLASALKDKRAATMSYTTFRAFLKSGGYLPLTKAQQYSLDYLKQRAYGDIRGLGNKIKTTVNGLIVTQSQKQKIKYQKIIHDNAVESIANGSTVTQLASALGDSTKDWARDFDRISDYVMHAATQHGICDHLLEKYGDDVEVYYSVFDGACEHCKRIYILDEKTGEPKVFKLKDILANGNNIGVKAIDYKPSVDPLHPWCRCTMHHKPDNTVWDALNKRWKLVRNTYGVNRKSKIHIKIN